MNIAGIAWTRKRTATGAWRWYAYAWRGGPCIQKTISVKLPRLTPEAVLAFHRAISERGTMPADTISGLAAAWRASPEWKGFAAETRRMWGRTLDAITNKWGPVPVSIFDDRRIKHKIIAWRDSMAETPRKADYHVDVLRSLLSYGRLLGRLSLNMADGIPHLYKGGNRAAIVWEPDDVAAFLAVAEQPVADAFNLARLTGLRRADLVALPWDAIKTHAIVWRTQKSGRVRVVSFPLIAPATKLLAELRTRNRNAGVSTVLVNSRGRAWTPDGLNSSFNDARSKTECRKRIHDLRGTAVTEWCLAGMSDAEIAGAFGWSPARVAEIRRLYVDQARVVVSIGERLHREENRVKGTR